MDDILEQLRALLDEHPHWHLTDDSGRIMVDDGLRDAIVEIERLRAENDQFRGFIDATSDPGDVADWLDEQLTAQGEVG